MIQLRMPNNGIPFDVYIEQNYINIMKSEFVELHLEFILSLADNTTLIVPTDMLS